MPCYTCQVGLTDLPPLGAMFMYSAWSLEPHSSRKDTTVSVMFGRFEAVTPSQAEHRVRRMTTASEQVRIPWKSSSDFSDTWLQLASPAAQCAP